jgi:aryl-alcohol dehydrogenase-like predicted oxidoreductase
MRKIPLSNSGVEVSALCLGAMFLGTRTDRDTSHHILDQYLDAGGTFIDSANIYAHWIPGFRGGESETLLGEWMRERRNRDRLFIATKVGFEYGDVQRDLKAWRIEEECNKSLKRLGIETIDLYYAHVDDYNAPLEETMEAFNRLVAAGKVRLVGASNYLAWRLERAKWISETNGWTSFCCVQQRYTYLRPRAGATFGPQVSANDDLLDYSRRNNFTILAYAALLGGAYTRDDRPLPEQYTGADNEARLGVLREVARQTGATPNQVILAWMLHRQPPVIPLAAASTHEQMEENLGALDVSLSKEQTQRLDSAGT